MRAIAESQRREYYDNYYDGQRPYYGPGYGYYGGPRYYYDPTDCCWVDEPSLLRG